ncbi:hypothetical protein [Pelagerythrobacter marinus]|uniref:hypothetical protein n=1 Tax=Pelagerythrobacter marinus TaxID=538382 RepID=UPI002AC9D36E|nr:hypothetical protein [Pelagerythrobacter marinus]WPZ05644.1 hypothetical protein T8T98_09400 [Pelagerythrobacter marinus]
MPILTDLIARIRKARTERALRATLRPDPEYRDRRLAQFSPERRQRYLDNIASISPEEATP